MFGSECCFDCFSALILGFQLCVILRSDDLEQSQHENNRIDYVDWDVFGRQLFF